MNDILDNLEYFRNNPSLNSSKLTDCLLDLYFYILSFDMAGEYLESFINKFILLNEEDKQIIKNEVINDLHLERKPKMKIKER